MRKEGRGEGKEREKEMLKKQQQKKSTHACPLWLCAFGVDLRVVEPFIHTSSLTPHTHTHTHIST